MDSDKDQVNYFEHDFNQLDLHSTWKVATKQKDQVNNGRRLENASWRRFFQKQFKLSTIKASEIGIERENNWLVGPLHLNAQFDGLKELEEAAAAAQYQSMPPPPNYSQNQQTYTNGLKRNKDNHHSLTRLADLNKI